MSVSGVLKEERRGMKVLRIYGIAHAPTYSRSSLKALYQAVLYASETEDDSTDST